MKNDFKFQDTRKESIGLLPSLIASLRSGPADGFLVALVPLSTDSSCTFTISGRRLGASLVHFENFKLRNQRLVLEKIDSSGWYPLFVLGNVESSIEDPYLNYQWVCSMKHLFPEIIDKRIGPRIGFERMHLAARQREMVYSAIRIFDFVGVYFLFWFSCRLAHSWQKVLWQCFKLNIVRWPALPAKWAIVHLVSKTIPPEISISGDYLRLENLPPPHSPWVGNSTKKFSRGGGGGGRFDWFLKIYHTVALGDGNAWSLLRYYAKDGGQGRSDFCVVFTMSLLCTWINTNVHKFAFSSQTALILCKHS